jgi:hypothetical protein
MIDDAVPTECIPICRSLLDQTIQIDGHYKMHVGTRYSSSAAVRLRLWGNYRV